MYIVVYYSLFADGTILKFLMRDLRQDLSCELLVLKLKSIDRRAPPGVEPVALFDSTWEISPGPDTGRMDRLIALS